MAVLTRAARAEIKEKIDDKRRARKESTHLVIQEAAERIALREGRAALTTKALVKEAGVSERTIFNHFPNIENVLISCLGLRFSALLPVQNFPKVEKDQDLPQAVEDFILGTLEDSATDQTLEKFVNLALTFTDNSDEDLSETLGADIFHTLTQMGWELGEALTADHPGLGLDQTTQLMIYIHSMMNSLVYGIGYYLHINQHVLQSGSKEYSLAELRQSMVWAARQVRHGRPDFSTK